MAPLCIPNLILTLPSVYFLTILERFLPRRCNRSGAWPPAVLMLKPGSGFPGVKYEVWILRKIISRFPCPNPIAGLYYLVRYRARIVLGDNTVAVANSLAHGRYPPNCVLQGNPAKSIMRRSQDGHT